MTKKFPPATPLALALAALLATSGCSSLLNEVGSAGAGIAGGALASAISNDPGVAAGIGIGVQAGTRAVLKYGQRGIHAQAQQQIASAAGALAVGEVGFWKTDLSVPLEDEEAGRVTVSRVISSGELDCKEIVFSVDRSGREIPARTGFYVASICRDAAAGWQWASAEPATARWGALQ